MRLNPVCDAFPIAELGDLVKQAMESLSQMKSMDSDSSQELEDLKVLYKKECLQRKLLYNKVSIDQRFGSRGLL